MEKPDLGIGIDDFFAVDRGLQPERAMHCRMLRSDVEDLRMRQTHGFRVFPGTFDDRQIYCFGAGSTLSRRKIFSQRVAGELRVREDPAQIRMPFTWSRFTVIERSPRNSRMCMRSSASRCLNAVAIYP